MSTTAVVGFKQLAKSSFSGKGIHKKNRLDFEDAFSPVIKHITIWLIPSMVVSFNQCICQIDIQNVFLQCFLREQVYMQQPPGFQHPQFSHHVCHLQRALYSLKQDPRAWFSRLNTKLLQLEFKASIANSSLFYLHNHNISIFILIYVDNIILTSPHKQLILYSIHFKQILQ